MMITVRRFFKYWIPVAIWMSVIFIMSGRQRITVSDDTVINFIFFKSLHLAEYAFLFQLSYRAYRNSFSKRSSLWWGIAALLLVIFYAATDEIHQTFIPTREGRIRDVIIDTAGAVLSWMILIVLLPKAPPKLKRWARNLDLI